MPTETDRSEVPQSELSPVAVLFKETLALVLRTWHDFFGLDAPSCLAGDPGDPLDVLRKQLHCLTA